jgi:hypothetical protein
MGRFMLPRLRRAAWLGMGLGVILVLSIVLARTIDRHTSAMGDVPDAATKASLVEQMSEDGAHPPDGAPKLLLPEDQRSPWIRAWNRMRDCAERHGFEGVGPVEPTFGDGKTPTPVIRMAKPGSDPMRDCPFDPSELDQERVREAVRASMGG